VRKNSGDAGYKKSTAVEGLMRYQWLAVPSLALARLCTFCAKAEDAQENTTMILDTFPAESFQY
jgi:23S rRNA maturation mini-RNase III